MNRVFKTRGEQFLEVFEHLYAQVRALEDEPFSEMEITGYIATMGISVERFFADTVLPDYFESYSGGGFFFDAIKNMYERGFDQEGINALNALRRIYNDQKHNPSRHISLKEVIAASERALDALNGVVATNLGKIGLKVFENSSVFWVAGTDYYHQGITEVFVYLPVESEKWEPPPILMSLFVKCSGWDDLMSTLDGAGQLFQSQELISQVGLEKMMHGDDPLLPRIYVGSIEPMLVALNKLRSELLADPLQASNTVSPRIAPHTTFLLALNYIKKIGGTCRLDDHELIKKQLTKTMISFGITVPDEQLSNEVHRVISLFSNLSPAAVQHISGPVWVDTESFDRMASIRNIRSEDGSYAFAPDMRLIIKLDEKNERPYSASRTNY